MKSLTKYRLAVVVLFLCSGMLLAQNRSKINTTYDHSRTTVKMAPVKISGDKDKYHSLHMSPSFSYPGREPIAPETIDFELQTVVKGKLRVDLYVVFIVDDETIFLSSNRWGIKRPIPGKRWMGERLVFRMPYNTLLKMAAAKTIAIKLDSVPFEFGVEPMHAIRDFAKHLQANFVSFRVSHFCLEEKSDPRNT